MNVLQVRVRTYDDETMTIIAYADNSVHELTTLDRQNAYAVHLICAITQNHRDGDMYNIHAHHCSIQQ